MNPFPPMNDTWPHDIRQGFRDWLAADMPDNLAFVSAEYRQPRPYRDDHWSDADNLILRGIIRAGGGQKEARPIFPDRSEGSISTKLWKIRKELRKEEDND